MSKVAITGNASGTGTFTIAAPDSNNNHTLTLPDEAGTVVTTAGASFTSDVSTTAQFSTNAQGSTSDPAYGITSGAIGVNGMYVPAANSLAFVGGATERMRIDSSGNLLVGATSSITAFSSSDTGLQLGGDTAQFIRDSGSPVFIARQGNDGVLITLFQGGSQEGSVSVSGSTVSYNGGHLARWSRLADDSKDTSIVKGTVMTNLDAMVVWSHDAVEAQDAVYDEEGNLVTEAVEAKDAYTEGNEQLNKMAVSSVEGDPNVAGVFVNWDEDDDDFNDMNIAMTGDMVIRIAEGTTVERGDLLMSAGDGTAKPQGDDIVRSKTIAKVTSTHVSHTYDDGSYLVPCVLMAC